MEIKNLDDQSCSSQGIESTRVDPLKEIGDTLKRARKEKRLSKSQLADSLRIGEEQLIALENGEQQLLPERVFIKAMIRRVAEKLGLDSEVLISQISETKQELEQEEGGKREVLINRLNLFNTLSIAFIFIGIVAVGITSKIVSKSNSEKNSFPKENNIYETPSKPDITKKESLMIRKNPKIKRIVNSRERSRERKLYTNFN